MNLVGVSFLSYFTDPVLRGPTIGCMLMCMAVGMIGVIVFLRKQSLLGEALSHATYPGVIMGVSFAGALSLEPSNETSVALAIMGGAFLSALLGFGTIQFLERRAGVRSDAALCLVLSSFFGIGLTWASHVQFVYPGFYRRVQSYLYGQAATMTDWHIGVYFLLVLAVLVVLALFYKELQLLIFDRDYAKTLGVNLQPVDALALMLIVGAVVIGIRSVGVVLLSAMLVAPAAAARQLSNRLHRIFLAAATFGLISGFMGNYLSSEVSLYLEILYPADRLSLPTGPMIVVSASLLCLASLFFAPERGFLPRLLRIWRFRYQILCENILKQVWKANGSISFVTIYKYQNVSSLYLRWVLTQLMHSGWLIEEADAYALTPGGSLWAARIVRLHRLWEVYLAECLGMGADRVHCNAEEMEHILTPEIEERLTLLLENPRLDPHAQPIPPKESL